MRHAEQDARKEMSQSPHLSEDRRDVDNHHDGVDIYDEPEDMTSETGTDDGRNGHYSSSMGGVSAEEGEFADGEGDDILDDDMMDKISSSPSIDDGGYLSPCTICSHGFFDPKITPHPSVIGTQLFG